MTTKQTSLQHQAADLACGRQWECACGACNIERVKLRAFDQQFASEQRGDYLYVVIAGNTTGPCFSLSDASQAKHYANALNRANRYPLLN